MTMLKMKYVMINNQLREHVEHDCDPLVLSESMREWGLLREHVAFFQHLRRAG